jgi:hypothetical protein
MSSDKETKVMRTEKETAQTRRKFLQLGALGAAAVVAAGVLPAGKASAQSTRTAKTVRSGGTIGSATGGKQTRSARKMRSMGEMGEKAEGGSTRSARSMQKQRTAKSTKSASNNRAMATRKAGDKLTMKSMKKPKA